MGRTRPEHKRYIERPIVVWAVQWDTTKESLDSIKDLVGKVGMTVDTKTYSDCISINTIAGDLFVYTGWHVVRKANNDVVVLSDQDFHTIYTSFKNIE